MIVRMMMSGMTREEAIEIIKTLPVYRAEMIWGGESDLVKALNMGIEALEKQIPKEVVYHDNCGNATPYQARCPKCYEANEETFYYSGESWCPYCGQALDWSKEND